MAESWASDEHARRTMVANRSKNTRPELAVRTLLHARGLRYRVHARPVASLRRTADIVFTRWRVAVFIDGCYWHGCPEHGVSPRRNADYWGPKLERNRARDRDTDLHLTAAGWTVLRFWEHEPPEHVADAVAAEIERARSNDAAVRP